MESGSQRGGCYRSRAHQGAECLVLEWKCAGEITAFKAAYVQHAVCPCPKRHTFQHPYSQGSTWLHCSIYWGHQHLCHNTGKSQPWGKYYWGIQLIPLRVLSPPWLRKNKTEQLYLKNCLYNKEKREWKERQSEGNEAIFLSTCINSRINNLVPRRQPYELAPGTISISISHVKHWVSWRLSSDSLSLKWTWGFHCNTSTIN